MIMNHEHIVYGSPYINVNENMNDPGKRKEQNACRDLDRWEGIKVT